MPLAASADQGKPPRGWHRPVRPMALVLVGASVLVLWLMLMVAATWFVYTRWEVLIDLRQQPVMLRLPDGMQATADVSAPVKSRLDFSPRVVVPLRQTLSAEVSDSIQAHMQLRTHVPLDTVVHIVHTVPINTTLQLSVPVVSWLPKFEVTVPLTLALPIELDVPVKLSVPLNLDALVNGELLAPLQVPLDMDMVLRPQIHAPLQASVTRQLAFRLVGPMAPMPVQIERAQLRVPFSVPTVR